MGVYFRKPSFRPDAQYTLALSTADAMAAEAVARGWQDNDAAAGIKTKKISTRGTDLEIAIKGAYAEAGFARLIGADWFDRWRATAVARLPKSQQPDVGPFHVRGTNPGGDLIVKPGDVVEPPYVLIWVVRESATIVFCGWAFGFEVARDQYWNDKLPRPAWTRGAATLAGWNSLWGWYRSRFPAAESA